MNARTAAALFFGGAIGLSSIGYALAGPADAHTSTVTLTDGVCAENTTWNTTLHITETVEGGTATIDDPASPYSVSVPVGGYVHTFVLANTFKTWTVIVNVSWPDGVKDGPHQVTVPRPANGCVPATTTTPTTVPATGPSTAPPTTVPTSRFRPDLPTLPTVSPTIVSPGGDTAKVAQPNTPSSAAATTIANCDDTTKAGDTGAGAQVCLPPTGNTSALIHAGWAALAAAIVGLALVVITRRRTVQS